MRPIGYWACPAVFIYRYQQINGLQYLFAVFLSPAPPLTIDRVYEAVKGVKNWRDFGRELGLYTQLELDTIESQYGSDDLRVKVLVEKFLRGESHLYPHPSWQAMIRALDSMNEIHLADQIIDYGEPVQGEWLCILPYMF